MTNLLANLGLYLLSGVFLVAGFAKLADRPGTSRSLVDFGVPAALRPAVAAILPRLEVAIGIALLVPRAAWWATLSGGALLLVFVAGIAYRLSRGETPECNCFGKLHSRPVDNLTLARNVALAAVAAALVFTASDRSLGSWSWLTALGWGEWLAVAALVVSLSLAGVLLRLWRQQGRLMNELHTLREGGVGERRLDEPSEPRPTIGSKLPPTKLLTADGAEVALFELLAAERDTLLVFVSATCGPCNALLPQVRQWERESLQPMPLVIQSGPVQLAQRIADEFGLGAVYSDPHAETFKALGASGTPAGVVVRPDGLLASSVVSGARALGMLATRASGSPIEPRDESDVVHFDNLPRLGGAARGG